LDPSETVDIAKTFSSLYTDLVRQFGIEQGTMMYLEQVPNSTLTDLFRGEEIAPGIYGLSEDTNPLAFTVPKNASRSGAPLPATETAVTFFDENEGYMKAYPYAAPYLLPQPDGLNDEFSQYAYDQQTINGLRERTDVKEFVEQLKFKEGSNKYFVERKVYLDTLQQAQQAGDTEGARIINDVWDRWSDNFLTTHPIFAQQLTGDTARNRRAKVIEEMRIIANDPDGPDSPQKAVIADMMDAYDWFIRTRGEMNLDRSAASQERIAVLESIFEEKMNEVVLANPAVQAFWLGVLRPEASLE
jgi:hypothetical protein